MSTIINGTSSAITFPDSSVQNTSAIVSGYVPYANLPAGSVLQVVQVVNTTQTSTSSTSYVATDLAVTITPKFSTSKILVVVSSTTVNTNVVTASSTIYRGGTNLGGGFNSGLSVNQPNGSYVWTPLAITYLDSPATTSATTYTLYIASGPAGTAYANWNNYASTITAMEIAA